MTGDLQQSLKQVFGYDSFRPLQQEIMTASLAGRDVVAILPTGGGKSLCYQLPALEREGLTVVISPLIALMKDQVDQLLASGVSATFLNSSLSPAETGARLAGLGRGDYKLLYLAPERLFLDGFLDKLKGWNITALAIDEAHCISEWGHDFRPEYRRLASLRSIFPGLPVMALTATATTRVREDIAHQLGLQNPEVHVASFNRPNLVYRVVPKQKPQDQVLEYVQRNQDASGIIYCQSRRSAEAHAETLRSAGIRALPYHAGLPQQERAQNQEAFIRDDVPVVCATIAFGMGINKPNVRYVLHADLPKNIEGYYQETGRAGRDGLPSECVLLFSAGDVVKNRHFINQMEDPAAAQVAEQQLRQMAGFGDHTDCRRAALLRYFGEHFPGENCGSCDNCLDDRQEVDMTQACQKLLSCIYRINQQGYPMGLNHAVNVLRGSKSVRVLEKGHDQLSTYGIGSEESTGYWQALGKQLLQKGFLENSDDTYNTVSPTEAAMQALRERTSFQMKPPQVLEKPPKSTRNRAGDIECDEGLFEKLRELRKQLADEQGVPPYVVFGDVALRHMARSYPASEEAFLAIPGFGQKKLNEYGSVFLETIQGWLTDHEPQSFSPLNNAGTNGSSASKKKDSSLPNPSNLETLKLFKSGFSIAQIAKRRGFTESTIEGHLARCVETGYLENIDGLVQPSEAVRIKETIAIVGTEAGLRPIYEELDEQLDFGKIRLVIAQMNRDADPTAQ